MLDTVTLLDIEPPPSCFAHNIGFEGVFAFSNGKEANVTIGRKVIFPSGPGDSQENSAL